MKLRSYDDFDLQQIEARLSGVRMDRTPDAESALPSAEEAWADKAQQQSALACEAEADKARFLAEPRKSGRTVVRPWFLEGFPALMEEFLAGVIISCEMLPAGEVRSLLSECGGYVWLCEEHQTYSFPNRPCC